MILESGAGNDADIWDTVGLAPDRTDRGAPGRGQVHPSVAWIARGTLLDADRRSRSDPVPQPHRGGCRG